LVIAATGWGFTALSGKRGATSEPYVATIDVSAVPAPTPVDPGLKSGQTVEILVAARDLPVGTLITKEDLPGSVAQKRILKADLTSALITDKDGIVGKRLLRAILKNEPFIPRYLGQGNLLLQHGEFMDLVTIPVAASDLVLPFARPGSRVDIIASGRQEDKLFGFTLMVDLLVLGVDNRPNTTSPSVSFAVTQEQALVLALAQKRGCYLQLLLRHPGKPIDKDYDIRKVLDLLRDISSDGKLKEGPSNIPAPRSRD
jgi:pilus assembly protein CpaB